jgi:hypothetical protein
MRTAILPLILAVAAAPLTARQAAAIQQNPKGEKPAADSSTNVVKPAVAVEAADSAKVNLSKASVDSLNELVNRFRRDPEAVALPSNNQIAMGGRTIPAGTAVAGPVAVAGGPLHVYGTVNGDAIAIGSDVNVTVAGGTVGGEIRQLAGALGAVQQAAEVESPARSTRHALALSSSWLIILVLMAIGVLLFAGDYLDGVVDSLEGRFGRSFWAGIATQLALAPVLCLLIVALAVTILGVLLIPFAIVAFVLAVVGLITLGFLAIARITGESVAPAATKRYSARGAALRALVVGVSIYMGLWVLASAFAWAPIVETVLRGVAVAITWVATTAGLGAAVISRGGTKRSAPTPSLAAVNDIPWQTPTPVTGIVAARRPTPASPSRDR